MPDGRRAGRRGPAPLRGRHPADRRPRLRARRRPPALVRGPPRDPAGLVAGPAVRRLERRSGWATGTSRPGPTPATALLEVVDARPVRRRPPEGPPPPAHRAPTSRTPASRVRRADGRPARPRPRATPSGSTASASVRRRPLSIRVEPDALRDRRLDRRRMDADADQGPAGPRRSSGGPTCCWRSPTASTSTPSSATRSTTPTTCWPASWRTRASTSSASAYGLDTAFVAKAGAATGRPSAIFCEYDALPEIGHACGHNIIAAAGLGAGLAAADLADELGGRVRRPRHAGRGGRRRQGLPARARAPSTSVDAAMMIHPAGRRPAGHERHRHPAGPRPATTARPPTPPPSRTGAATPSTPPCSAT